MNWRTKLKLLKLQCFWIDIKKIFTSYNSLKYLKLLLKKIDIIEQGKQILDNEMTEAKIKMKGGI